MSWTDAPQTPRPKHFVRHPSPPPRRSFKSGDLVRSRDSQELVGRVIIPAHNFPSPLPRVRSRVKIIWWTAAGQSEWVNEDKLMAIDIITELGRLA